MEEGLVGIPACKDAAGGLCGPVQQRQIQHGLDALGAALGAVKGMAAAEKGRGVFFAFRYDALRGGQIVRPGNLGDIKGLAAQGPHSLMTGHMQPQDAACRIVPDKIADGGIHAAYSSALKATCSMMAHSMRFLKSSQPYS